MATATHRVTEKEATAHPPPEAVVVRFAGDSGDGMQLTGGQFTLSTALAGNDLATFPDFPAEIRAPQGTTFGVSAFQINFGSTAIETAGDQPGVLIAMNPAALKVNVEHLREGGLIIADEGEFLGAQPRQGRLRGQPAGRFSLAKWQVVHFNISQLTLDAVKPFGLGNKEALRCKNMWSAGPRAVDVRPRPGADRRLARGQVAKAPSSPTPTSQPSTPGMPRARPPRSARFKTAPCHRSDGARALPHRHRRQGAGTRPGRGPQSSGLKCSSAPIRSPRPRRSWTNCAAGIGVTTFQAKDEIAAIGRRDRRCYAGSSASPRPGPASR